MGALPNLPAAVGLLACLLQAPGAPSDVAVLAPRSEQPVVDQQLVDALDGRVAFFPDRPSLVSLRGGGVAVDPYSKALNKLESGELIVDGVVVDQAQPAYVAAHDAWQRRDMDALEELGVGAVVVDSRIVAETAAPAPAVPWALTTLWLLLASAAFPLARQAASRKPGQSSPTST